MYVNVDAYKSLPLADFIAAAGNYAYANLWLWEGRTLPWRLAADVIIAFFLSR
jgi:hypothetical protein